MKLRQCVFVCKDLESSREELCDILGIEVAYRDPGVAKARAEFEHAQRAEETFHKDFDGLDLTMSVTRIRTVAPPTSFSVATIQK